MYINPIYDKPMREGVYLSQHPYAMNQIGEPYVCSYHENNFDELLSCINKAMIADLLPMIPNDFRIEEYYKRVANIFQLN